MESDAAPRYATACNVHCTVSPQALGADEFYIAVWHFVVVIAVAAPLGAASEFVQQRLVLAWRIHLTSTLVDGLFADASYYRVIHIGGIDNPDQRITQDVASFVSASTSVITILVKKVFNCAAFASVLWSVSPTLVYVLFTYALVGTWITTSVFGRKLMSLQFKSLKQEADLRFALMRVRENAESIAFYDGSAAESACVRTRFRDAVGTHRITIAWSSLLDLWRNAYTYATILVPSVVTAPRYFAGEIQFGVITQAGFAFGRIESALSLIISSLESLSGLAAQTERLHDLCVALNLLPLANHEAGADSYPGVLQRLLYNYAPRSAARYSLKKDAGDDDDADADDVKGHKKADGDGRSDGKRVVSVLGRTAAQLLQQPLPSSGKGARISGSTASPQILRAPAPSASVLLELSGVSASSPGGGCVVARGLSLQLKRGESILVMGPSGCGKTSLLRICAGLWTHGSGTVACASREDCAFLPQKPYMPLGSLRQQFLFPEHEGEGSAARWRDADLRQLAKQAKLPRLQDETLPLDAVDSWADVFSVGEQQRIAFARLFRARPALAFLDESTSAMDLPTESALYSQLAACCGSYVSIGHRPQLAKFHTHVLQWQAPGEWALMDANRVSSALT